VYVILACKYGGQKKEVLGSFETSIHIYQFTRRHTSEESILAVHCHENLPYRIFLVFQETSCPHVFQRKTEDVECPSYRLMATSCDIFKKWP
jgi:hypothetical protein